LGDAGIGDRLELKEVGMSSEDNLHHSEFEADDVLEDCIDDGTLEDCIDDGEFEEFEESAGDEEFEEITSEEVDRVMELLEGVAASVQSQNILTILNEASDSIYELVYDEEDAVEGDEPVSDAA
jgi:hypothetical protein